MTDDNSGMSSDDTEQNSIWPDCAECESGNTQLGFIGDPNPIICYDCGAETGGVDKPGGPNKWGRSTDTDRSEARTDD